MNDELQMTNRKMQIGEMRTPNHVSFSSTFETQHSDFASFDIRNSTFGIRPVPPKGNANFACCSIRHSKFGLRHSPHLAPQGMAGFVLANGSMSSNQSGEGMIQFFGKAFLSLVKDVSSGLRTLVARPRMTPSQFLPSKPATVLS